MAAPQAFYTWLHQADRNWLKNHPRSDLEPTAYRRVLQAFTCVAEGIYIIE